MAGKRGSLSIKSENIFPIIKKWLYSDHDIFFRELVSNGCDAITKLKKLEMMGECSLPADYKGKIKITTKDYKIMLLEEKIQHLLKPKNLRLESIKRFLRPRKQKMSYAEKAVLEFNQKQEKMAARAAAKTRRRPIYDKEDR